MEHSQTIKTIKNLLQNVAIINNKYDDIAKVTGENFNIFKTLGLSTNEVRTHSAFIGELLNPKGSHDLGDIFLKEFLQIVKESSKTEELNNFKSENCTIEIEKFAGHVTDNYEEGGRIDIILTDSENNAIIIENKIYADDQKNQLSRYFKYGQKNYHGKFQILYLTLDGKAPSPDSLGSLKEKDFIKISYSVDIINWLEVCKQKAVNHSTLRETLTQYINLIKHLTNNTINNDMKNEIIKTILNDESNLMASFEIEQNIYSAKEQIITEMARKIANNFKLKFEVKSNLIGIVFFKEIWEEGCGIWFAYDNFKLYYSIKTNEAIQGQANEEDWQFIKDLFNIEPSRYNPFGYRHVYNDHWKNNNQIYCEMINGTFAEENIILWLKKALVYLEKHPEIEKLL